MAKCLDAGYLVRDCAKLTNSGPLIRRSTNSGQNCIGIERLIVHSSLYDHLLDALTDRVQQLRLGPPTHSVDGFTAPVDCGSMISRDRIPEIERLVSDASYHGAQMRHGGTRWHHVYLEEGVYFTPTVIGDVTPAMEIAQTEGQFVLCLLLVLKH